MLSLFLAPFRGNGTAVNGPRRKPTWAEAGCVGKHVRILSRAAAALASFRVGRHKQMVGGVWCSQLRNRRPPSFLPSFLPPSQLSRGSPTQLIGRAHVCVNCLSLSHFSFPERHETLAPLPDLTERKGTSAAAAIMTNTHSSEDQSDGSWKGRDPYDAGGGDDDDMMISDILSLSRPSDGSARWCMDGWMEIRRGIADFPSWDESPLAYSTTMKKRPGPGTRTAVAVVRPIGYAALGVPLCLQFPPFT
jgi:hypothetical protein